MLIVGLRLYTIYCLCYAIYHNFGCNDFCHAAGDDDDVNEKNDDDESTIMMYHDDYRRP